MASSEVIMINFIDFRILSKIELMIKLIRDLFERSRELNDHFI
jgi:hypothetical protein